MLYCLPDFIHNYRSLLRSPLQPSRRPFTMTVSYPFQVSSTQFLSFSLYLFSSQVLSSRFARQVQSVPPALPKVSVTDTGPGRGDEVLLFPSHLSRSLRRHYRLVRTHAIRVEVNLRMRKKGSISLPHAHTRASSFAHLPPIALSPVQVLRTKPTRPRKWGC